MSQFPNVNGTYGAPMGRRESPHHEGKIRLFRVRLDSGGYDNGGAYWGLGKALYCALSDGGMQFTRARSRAEAVELLNLDVNELARKPRERRE